MDSYSLESSLTMGDSDSESTSASSSMQSSISSATSSLDQNSSNVKEGSRETKTLNKSISKKFASFGSFISSRRRSQSRLSQSFIKLSDDGSVSPPRSSSIETSDTTTISNPDTGGVCGIEASDESSNYVKKPIPKFTRTGSLRSVKILRSKSKNKNKSSFKSKKSSTDKNSEISEESHFENATFSSTLKDSKFPKDLKHQTGPLEPEEVLPEAKVCPYQHCSLHGHHHHNHDPPQKRFAYLKRGTKKDQKIVNPESQPMDKSSAQKKETKKTKKVSNDVDFSIEFYAKTRSEPLSSYGHHDGAEFADILFGVNSFQEKKNEIPISNHQDIIDLNDKNDDNSNGSKSFLEKKSSLKKTNHISMWHMIHQHMVSGLEAESDDIILQQEHEEKKSNTKDFDDDTSQETEIRKMFAIKLVRDAIEKILLPEVQDDQSTTSEVISEQDLSEKNQNEGEKPLENVETEKRAPKRWSYLKKVILLTKFVKELEKVKKFNPKKVILPPASEQEKTETVFLRKQTTGDKKNSDEWMLDYALQRVVGELAPTQKRKVALLVKAFETVAPAQDDPQESRSNGELQRASSEISEPEIKSTTDFGSNLFSEKDKEPRSDFEKEKHIKMWHMIYQHVATDIATKIGSDLLLDDEESTNGDEKNLQEDFRIAVNLVRESVNEILLPDVSDKDFVIDETKKQTIEEPLSSGTRLQQQRSKNWTKLKKLILLKRSIKALEGFRSLKPQTPEQEILKSDRDEETVDLRRQMMDERKKAEQWMLDYAVQHIVTKLTPARKKRVSMLVEAFEAVVPFPAI